MVRSVVAAMIVALMLAGCASYDRQMATDFLPSSDKLSFVYRAFADAAIGLDTPSGEAYRMDMLGRWLSENSMCGRGYDIVERQVVQRSSGLLANVHDVNYKGRCR